MKEFKINVIKWRRKVKTCRISTASSGDKKLLIARQKDTARVKYGKIRHSDTNGSDRGDKIQPIRCSNNGSA